MGKCTSRVMIFTFFLAICFPSLLLSQNSNTPDNSWSTKEFRVFWHSPDLEDRITTREILSDPTLTDAEKLRLSLVVSFINDSLTEIATFYEKHYIEQPLLPFDEDEKRWEVYAYRFDEGWIVNETEKFAAGYYSPYICGATAVFNPELRINVKNLLDVDQAFSEDVKFGLYDTLAHEMFHAIQAAYDKKYSSVAWCKSGSGNGFWPVIEGTATAAATLATAEKYPRRILTGINNPSVGAFPYASLDFLTVGSAYAERAKPNGDPDLAYKTSSFWKYLAETYGSLNVFHILFNTKLTFSESDPTLEERYVWLDQGVREMFGKSLYLVYPSFLSEFASFGQIPDKAGRVSERDWLSTIYRKGAGTCWQVDLNSSNGGAASVELNNARMLVEQGTTCFEVKWSGISKPFKIEVEAEYPNESILDQLHLGVSRLSTDGKKDNCHQWIGKQAEASDVGYRDEFHCSFGKTSIKFSELKYGFIKMNQRKDWDIGWPPRKDAFFSRKLSESGEAIVIMTNIGPVPGKTNEVPHEKSLTAQPLMVRFTVRKIKTTASMKFEPPEYVEGIVPGDLNVAESDLSPDRYSFYGIVKGTRIPQFGSGSGFQAVSVDNEEKRYYVTPTVGGDYSYGSTGPFKAAVWTFDGPSSIACEAARMGPPDAVITRSDEFQLRFNVKANLCLPDPSTRSARVVETFDAEFTLPFAQRYFRETAQADVVTPGVEQYIDEFLLDAVRLGIPIPPGVRMEDGSYPPNALAKRRALRNGKKDTGKTNQEPGCKCTCDEYERIKKSLEEAQRTKRYDSKTRSDLYCWQKCMPEFRPCFLK